jgi:osmotically-inducible protein OsmY
MSRIISDEEIQQDVLQELDWDPRVEPEEIGVSVDGGIVTLTGFIDSYSKKIAAEQATHRVRGVRAVANDLTVRLPANTDRTDADLARAVLSALTWDAEVPSDEVEVTVADGWVTLEGSLPWRYQREVAEAAVHRLAGVRGVSNNIVTRPRIKPSLVRSNIEKALVRSAETDARRITVEVDGARIVLKGSVRTPAELRDTLRVAWSAPGVEEVDNQIVIMPEIGDASAGALS